MTPSELHAFDDTASIGDRLPRDPAAAEPSGARDA